MAGARHDYAYPVRIDAGARQAARAGYEDHVLQMVKQVLLTSPGERADLPEFGCGLRALIFAGNSDALSATAQILVLQALTRWLADHLTVIAVEVLPPSTRADDSALIVRVEYQLIRTRATARADVWVR